jgi:hypothetical protein
MWVDMDEISLFKIINSLEKNESLSFVSVRLIKIASVNKNIYFGNVYA